MKTFANPPMSQWQPLVRSGGPIIATGHQAGFWHPGILAKCLASVNYARQVGGQSVYVLVDHDDNDSCLLELPVIRKGQLQVRRLSLAPSLGGVALRSQPQIDWNKAARLLRDEMQSTQHEMAADIQPLLTAIEAQPESNATRADQWASMLQTMWQPILGNLKIIHATSLMDHAIIDELLHDARNCARCYNEAVATQPKAGMSPLIIERDRVELPLWDIAEASSPSPRRRVFADLSDSKPWLVRSDGQPIGQSEGRYLHLAPRALLLTAIMRSAICDLFIHGHGGSIYDRVMEQWWTQWTGQSLAPMAVVSADVRLPFQGIAQSSRDDLTRAIWFAHHLPHNLDRYLPASELDEDKVQRKVELLSQMEIDRDGQRRSNLFRELHTLNRQFAAQNEEVLALSQEQLQRIHLGMANSAIAQKRNWSFMLYDRVVWHELATDLAG